MLTEEKGLKRGISIYSYSAEFGTTKTLEDCFADMSDMGAKGLEILANTHIENYPYPTDEWVSNWFKLIKKYDLKPVEYGHWIDSHVLGYRELTTEETAIALIRDIKLAARLGFHIMRTKMSVIDDDLMPIKNWREVITRVLPTAEAYDVCLCPEIHVPANLKSDMVKQYTDFIDETGTKNFGLNIDLSSLRTKWFENEFHPDNFIPSVPEDFIPILPYVKCIHAKYINITDDFEETTIPYPEIIKVLQDNHWNGYLLSEYEGADKYDDGYEVGQTLRKQHIMLKRLIGE
ncbi:sugar phosphate isomerase/epimerase [Lactiplantibacillus pentosus]|uniref:Sugar phosphate isomerase/epimerase n=1 Tax=Lactiplantibacillus pentosus TaxID=1589 RepID=A0AB37RM70_LACPE|nr:sugar phosphate isomerase/epimerase [Lactiplantibacillus pentosus]RMW50210.1 sugar phosphate isomerase/epimerase [Lactiplantibacillus pentosus]RMW52917.1 sugar phosphate isomerase/epimerase [Lactiplantibacillus pentosus]RMW55894.1 sugar phosphate isomerase/epimerase [Lactiplantibacillus pentosus]